MSLPDETAAAAAMPAGASDPRAEGQRADMPAGSAMAGATRAVGRVFGPGAADGRAGRPRSPWFGAKQRSDPDTDPAGLLRGAATSANLNTPGGRFDAEDVPAADAVAHTMEVPT